MFEDYYVFYHQNLGDAESDFKPIVDEPAAHLTFANSQSKKTLAAVWVPICIGGAWSQVKVHILDAPAPMLLGVEVLSTLGARMDFESGVLISKKHGTQMELHHMGSGHWAIDLYRADPVALAAVQDLRPRQSQHSGPQYKRRTKGEPQPGEGTAKEAETASRNNDGREQHETRQQQQNERTRQQDEEWKRQQAKRHQDEERA